MAKNEIKRVLIVDNDSDTLDVMQDALNYDGFDVKGVLSTDDILATIADYQPGIVFIDYLLNGINGGELCHQIKSNQNTENIPVVVMSAYPRVFNSLGSYGCDAFMPKPFDLHQLTNCIKYFNTCNHSLNYVHEC